ncbi:serine/threonine-protein kinase [Streptomyces sp. B6B3]|uniref:serine/threonine-protein kinase n=1 Tax=Streptomyces sp. B6B3 TaxID=3153570 RepID=UPI00325F428C
MEALRPQDPHRIGPYRLLARLGEGGMGTVYLARSTRARTVAVKTIKPELASAPDFRRRFSREIIAARRVGGRWTAPVLDADTEAETPWVATGYIAGPSLYQVVSHDHGPLPERSVLLLAAGMAQALKAIHDAGLVHRDLKPSNVLITVDGPRVIDFGIARALEAAAGEGITRAGAALGSPGFMSPEQVRGQRLTPASDVFGLGSLLAYAATGRTPYGKLDTSPHLLSYRTVEEPPDLTGVPEGLRTLISDCMARSAAQRPPLERLLAYPPPGPGTGPWLPAEVLARLGRDAASLLDSENPRTLAAAPARREPAGGQEPGPPAPGGASPAGGVPALPAPPPSPSPFAAAPTPGAPTHAPTPPAASGGGSGMGTPPRVPVPKEELPFHTPYVSRPARSRRLLLGLAAGVALAVLGVVGAVALTGGDEEESGDSANGGQSAGDSAADGAAVADGYLGAWQGEYGSQGETGWKALWFEIRQGEQGGSVGTAVVSYMDATCVYDLTMQSFDEGLRFTEVADYSVPEAEIQELCRGGGTVQSLMLQDDGDLLWTSADQQAVLQPAGEGGQDVVPESLVDSWYDEFSTDEVENGIDDVTIAQGAVGDTVLRWDWVEDEMSCLTEARLAQVDGDRILLAPGELDPAESDEDCFGWSTAWAWTDSQGVLYIQWTDEPYEDPYEIFHDR